MLGVKRSLIVAAFIVTSNASAATLSIFTDFLRQVIIPGERIEAVIVYKTGDAFAGGTGTFALVDADGKAAVSSTFKVPAITRDRHVEVLTFDTTSLKPGNYTLEATVGALKSNRYTIEIVARERKTNFGLLDVSWWNESNIAYQTTRYRPFRIANINMELSSGTGNEIGIDVPAVEPPPGKSFNGWQAQEAAQAQLRENWRNDFGKPAFELHPARKRNEYAHGMDGALREGVSTAYRPYNITDRAWAGMMSFSGGANASGGRFMYHAQTRRSFMNWTGFAFNDDPMPHFGPGESETPPKWRHLHPLDDAVISPNTLDSVIALGRYGPWRFKGQILNVGTKPMNRYFRKTIDIPFEPKEVLIEFYQADRLWFWINGKRTGFIRDSGGTILFDITDTIKAGKNVVAVEGRNVGWIGYMAAAIRATDNDGNEQYWFTDTTWKTLDPHIDSENKFNGSLSIEGVKESPKWTRPGYDDSGWDVPTMAHGSGPQGKKINNDVGALKPQEDHDHSRNKRIFHCWDTCQDLARFYHIIGDQIRDMDPGLRTTTNQGLYWGPGSGEYTPIQYRALDYGISVLYTDQGEFPLSDCFDADRFQRGMKPGTYQWVGLSNFWQRNNVFLRGVRTVGRKVGGIGFFNGGGGIHSGKGWKTNTGITEDEIGRRFQMENLLIVMQAYGEMIKELEEDDKVAWLGNWTEEASGPWQWGRPQGFYNMHEAHYALMRAHFPGTIVEERELLEGRLTPEDYPVLLITARKEPLPREVVVEVRRYMAAGGHVLISKCAPAAAKAFPNAARLDADMSGHFVRHNSPQWDNHIEFIRPEKAFIGYQDTLRSALYEAVIPFVDATSMWITFSTQKYGKAKYVFAVNDMWPPLHHDKLKFWVNKWDSDQYGSLTSTSPPRMFLTMPAKHKLYFNTSDGDLPEGFVVYDLMHQKQLELKDEDGRRTTEIHFVNNPARILACIPKPIDTVSLAVSPTVAPGELVRFKVRVLDADGEPIDALFPIEIRVSDADGKERYHIWRNAGPDREKMLKIATNDTPGTWTFHVRELMSGRTSQKTFTVKSKAAQAVAVTANRDKAIVMDEYNVWKMLTQNQEEGPVIIVMGAAQKRLEPDAKRLKQALIAAGTKAKIKYFDAIKTPAIYGIGSSVAIRNGELRRNTGGAWNGVGVGTPPLRVMRNVIILSTVKLSELKGYDLVYDKEENPANLWYLKGHTPNYPAPGWGLIQYFWGPTIVNYDAVHVFGWDDEGLRRGIDKLIALTKRNTMERGPTLRRTFDPEGPVVGGDVYRERLRPGPAPNTKGQTHGRKQEVILQGRMGIPVRTAAISPDSNTIAVGTDGYGENLYVFDRSGKLKWKTKEGVLNVRFLRFSKDGKKFQVCSNVEGLYYHKTEADKYHMFSVRNTSVYDVASGTREQFLHGKQDPLGVSRKVVKVDPLATPPSIKRDGATIRRVGPDGQALWEYTTELRNQNVQRIAVSPSGKWVGFNAWRGKQPWISGDPILVLLDNETGKKVWQKGTPGIQPGHNEIRMLDSGVMMLKDSDGQGRPMFTLLEPKAGRVVYEYVGDPGAGDFPFELGGGGAWILLTLGGTDPQLRFVFLTGEAKDSALRFDEEIDNYEFVDNGTRLVAATWDSKVTLINIKDSSIVWQTRTKAGPTVRVSQDERFAVVTTIVGWVHFIDMKTGKILWQKDLNKSEEDPQLYGKIIAWMKADIEEAWKRSGEKIRFKFGKLTPGNPVMYLP